MARDYDPGGQIRVRHHNIGPLAYDLNPGGDINIFEISSGGVGPRMDSPDRWTYGNSKIFGYKIISKFSVRMSVTEISISKFLTPSPNMRNDPGQP